jgi:hypothetical protein
MEHNKIDFFTIKHKYPEFFLILFSFVPPCSLRRSINPLILKNCLGFVFSYGFLGESRWGMEKNANALSKSPGVRLGVDEERFFASFRKTIIFVAKLGKDLRADEIIVSFKTI